jgi:hypothetical protein
VTRGTRRERVESSTVTTAERRAATLAVGAALFVGFAVVLEIVAGTRANSSIPGWAEIMVPLAWPRPMRVAWWLAVAAAMGSFHWSLHRLGVGQPRFVAGISVAPFLVFAAGVGAGQSWATFH